MNAIMDFLTWTLPGINAAIAVYLCIATWHSRRRMRTVGAHFEQKCEEYSNELVSATQDVLTLRGIFLHLCISAWLSRMHPLHAHIIMRQVMGALDTQVAVFEAEAGQAKQAKGGE